MEEPRDPSAAIDLGSYPLTFLPVHRRSVSSWIFTFLAPFALLLGGSAISSALGKPKALSTLFGLCLISLWVLLPLLGWATLPSGRARRVRLSAGEAGVSWTDEKTGAVKQWSRAEIAGGHLRPGPWPKIELHATSGDIVEIDVKTAADGQRILRTLSLDASSRRARFSGAHRNMRAFAAGLFTSLLVLVLGAVISPAAKSFGAVMWLMTPGIFGFLAARLMPSDEVVVGTDGVVVRGLLGRRFHRHDDIVRVQVDGPKLSLQLQTGKTVTARLSPEDAKECEARIAEALATRGNAPAAEAKLDLDASAGTFAALRERIGKALDPAGVYRANAVSEDELIDAVGDPHTARRKRVAAAWAIGLSQRAELRQRARLRVESLADASSRELMTRALEDRLAEDDLAELEADQASAEQDERRAR